MQEGQGARSRPLSAVLTGSIARPYRLNRVVVIAAAVFLGLALVAGATAFSFSDKLAVARRQVAAIADSAHIAAARAAKDSAISAAAIRRAHDAEQTRLRDSVRTADLETRLAQATARARKAVTAAPDTCDEAIAALEGSLLAANELAVSYHDRLDTETAEHERTKLALIRTHADLVDAQRSLKALASAADAVEIPRESWLSRLLPKPSIGCTAGMSPITSRVDTVCGVSIGWEVRL